MSGFTRLSGRYACRLCKRQTRDTGDNGDVRLYQQCYDLAGIENAISDSGDSPDMVRRHAPEARRLLLEVRKKGGMPKFSYEEQVWNV